MSVLDSAWHNVYFVYSPRRYIQALGRWPEIVAAARAARPFHRVARDYLSGSSGAYPLQVRVGGLELQLEELEDTKILWNIFFRHCYPVRHDDQVIVDAGANCGLFAMFAATAAPQARIVSIEPLPETFRRLQSHIQRNALTDRIQALNLALSDRAGKFPIADEAVPSGQKRLLSGSGGEFARPGVEVACQTLSGIVNECGLSSIDFVKMDIEGAEYGSLLATPVAILGRIKRMVVEVHRNPNTASYQHKDLIDHLAAAGLNQISFTADDEGFGLAAFERQRVN
jgi:FkbM family methyltransferase